MSALLSVAVVTLALHGAIALWSNRVVKRHVSLNLRVYEQAPPPLPTAESIKEADKFEPGKWWKVLDPGGKLWLETSNEKEARENVRTGDTLHRLYEKSEAEWREETR